VNALLEVRHVTRRFSGLVAVNDVSFTLDPDDAKSSARTAPVKRPW
jgi:ABC-type branched-subunit amino acid transport system ATPase component